MQILITGCLLPLHTEATINISLDHLGTNTAVTPLFAVVKCRSNFALWLKELKKQGADRSIHLSSCHTLPAGEQDHVVLDAQGQQEPADLAA